MLGLGCQFAVSLAKCKQLCKRAILNISFAVNKITTICIYCRIWVVGCWSRKCSVPGNDTLSYSTPYSTPSLFTFNLIQCTLAYSFELYMLPSLLVMVTLHNSQLAPVAVIRFPFPASADLSTCTARRG